MKRFAKCKAKVSIAHSSLDLKDIIAEVEEQEGEGGEGVKILTMKIIAIETKRVEPAIATTEKIGEGTDTPNKQISAREVTKDNTCKIDNIR